jgi:hypothetical protein
VGEGDPDHHADGRRRARHAVAGPDGRGSPGRPRGCAGAAARSRRG